MDVSYACWTGSEAGACTAGESQRQAGGSVVPEQEGKVCKTLVYYVFTTYTMRHMF
jgi:hypothetical protein